MKKCSCDRGQIIHCPHCKGDGYVVCPCSPYRTNRELSGWEVVAIVAFMVTMVAVTLYLYAR